MQINYLINKSLKKMCFKFYDNFFKLLGACLKVCKFCSYQLSTTNLFKTCVNIY
jgi:hypothetical protein